MLHGQMFNSIYLFFQYAIYVDKSLNALLGFVVGVFAQQHEPLYH